MEFMFQYWCIKGFLPNFVKQLLISFINFLNLT